MDNKHGRCSQLLALISDYVDGTLTDELCGDLEHHISNCQNCRIVVDTLQKTIYLYQKTSADTAEIPQSAREHLYQKLNLEDYYLKK